MSIRCVPKINKKWGRIMILIRFAIALFGLALLGMAFSLNSAHSQESYAAPAFMVTVR
jgi:hypothetical protein